MRSSRLLIFSLLITLAQFSVSWSVEFVTPVRPYLQQVEDSLSNVPDERKERLDSLLEYVVERALNDDPIKLVFICTHNSRRSQMSQVWCQVAAAMYGITGVEAYSGGTEETACNLRTIQAFRRAGLSAVATTQGENPVYLIQYSDDHQPIKAYSKVFRKRTNPNVAFAALMCCSDADEQCPVVTGADIRVPLHYVDPKVADNTSLEEKTYDDRCFQIAQEMFYVMSVASEKIRLASES